MANTSKTKDKVENPEAHFAKPKQVVKDNVLSHDEKKNALNTWEQDERQLLTASNQATKECPEAMKVSGWMTIIALARWSGLKGRSAKSRSTNHLIRCCLRTAQKPKSAANRVGSISKFKLP
jgi:hypothetical protein